MPGHRKSEIARELGRCRDRTLALLATAPDEFLKRRVHSFYSPIGWHFGHVGRTEEYWVVGEALHRPLLDDKLTFLFADLPDNPKDNRVNIPDRGALIGYLERTRTRVLEALEESDLDSEDPFLQDGYAWEFAIQHEYQHQETILEMLQLIQKEIGPRPVTPVEWRPTHRGRLLPMSGGSYSMGTDSLHSYDNEKEPHSVEVAPFRLGDAPVSAAEWLEFMSDGGYTRKSLWSDEGWEWREGERAVCPEYWFDADGLWAAFSPLGTRAVHPDEPASCLSWYEAETYAKWAGYRLPTEEEWEWARRQSCHEPTFQMATQPRPMSEAPPDGLGCKALAGEVWQWTSSPFLPYPGFVAFPYEGYSKDHMKGAHRVCRGGSWATSKPILRPTFRNWYLPTYRQGFLGVRLAAN